MVFRDFYWFIRLYLLLLPLFPILINFFYNYFACRCHRHKFKMQKSHIYLRDSYIEQILDITCYPFSKKLWCFQSLAGLNHFAMFDVRLWYRSYSHAHIQWKKKLHFISLSVPFKFKIATTTENSKCKQHLCIYNIYIYIYFYVLILLYCVWGKYICSIYP